MAYCEELTRKQLKEMGFTGVEQTDDGWIIHRYWYKNNSKTFKYDHTIKITNNEQFHPRSGNTKVYKNVTWWYKGRNYTTTLNRFLIAWFKRKIKKGMVADHIDNDTINNSLENLKITTIRENNRKRFIDNPDCKCFNQYKNTNK